MKILFIHPNFPAQFRHVASSLGASPENEVIFVTANPRPDWHIKGVRKVIYKIDNIDPQGNVFPPREFTNALNSGRAVLEILLKLKSEDFYPDVVYGHSGWGTTFFVKDVFPQARLICYFEWFYKLNGTNLDFDPNNPPNINTATNIRLRNVLQLNDLEICDFGISPTIWQKNQFPPIFKNKIHQLHDGIDIDYFKPELIDELNIPELNIPPGTKLVTYTARGFEPYRGFPQFMEALSILLQQNHDFHAVIAGSDRICYGPARQDGQTWRQHMLKKFNFDESRVHFTGALPYGQYVQILKASTVHVYLTYPFVLSWSLLEAMSCGCAVVASNTPPVREVIDDGVNGILADFFSAADLAAKINGVLTYPSFVEKIRENARNTIEGKYSLKKLLPKHLKFITDGLKTNNDLKSPLSGGPFG